MKRIKQQGLKCMFLLCVACVMGSAGCGVKPDGLAMTHGPAGHNRNVGSKRVEAMPGVPQAAPSAGVQRRSTALPRPAVTRPSEPAVHAQPGQQVPRRRAGTPRAVLERAPAQTPPVRAYRYTPYPYARPSYGLVPPPYARYPVPMTPRRDR